MGRHGGHPSLKRTLTLEGCGPSQPRNPIKANIGCMPCCSKTKFPSFSSAPRNGRPPGLDQSSNSRFLTWRPRFAPVSAG